MALYDYFPNMLRNFDLDSRLESLREGMEKEGNGMGVYSGPFSILNKNETILISAHYRGINYPKSAAVPVDLGTVSVREMPNCCGMLHASGWSGTKGVVEILTDVVRTIGYYLTYTIVQAELCPRANRANQWALEYWKTIPRCNEWSFNSRRTHNDIHVMGIETEVVISNKKVEATLLK